MFLMEFWFFRQIIYILLSFDSAGHRYCYYIVSNQNGVRQNSEHRFLSLGGCNLLKSCEILLNVRSDRNLSAEGRENKKILINRARVWEKLSYRTEIGRYIKSVSGYNAVIFSSPPAGNRYGDFRFTLKWFRFGF